MESRKFKRYIFLLLILFYFLSGCAGFVVVKEQGHTRYKDNVGFQYFEPKTYLIIEKKEKETSARLMSIPNLSEPRYLKYKRGIGSVQFSFVLNNGILTNFGQTTDSKIPETITAVGSLGGLLTGMAQTGMTGTMRTAFRANVAQVAFDLKPISEGSKLLKEKVIKQLKGLNVVTLNQIVSDLETESNILDGLKTISDPNEMIDLIATINKRREKVMDVVLKLNDLHTRLSAQLDVFVDPKTKSTIAEALHHLLQIIKNLSLFGGMPESYKIFEMIPDGNGGITFKSVFLPKK